MEEPQEFILTDHWLTHEPRYSFGFPLFFLLLITFSLSYLNWENYFSGTSWIPASGQLALDNNEYWRLWTSLFAHAHFGHIASNLILFIPLTFLLSSFYGAFLPFWGILFGGLINFLTLSTMHPETYLIGISGVVSWMGATWLMLFLLIDRRRSLKYRLAVVLFLTLLLFVPSTYEPQVSYLSHFYGYIFGILFGGFYFLIHKSTFRSAERWVLMETPEMMPEENLQAH
jgi:rhomboid protease GluP